MAAAYWALNTSVRRHGTLWHLQNFGQCPYFVLLNVHRSHIQLIRDGGTGVGGGWVGGGQGVCGGGGYLWLNSSSLRSDPKRPMRSSATASTTMLTLWLPKNLCTRCGFSPKEFRRQVKPCNQIVHFSGTWLLMSVHEVRIRAGRFMTPV